MRTAVGVDGGDGPGVAVADLHAVVGAEVRVVAAGGDLVAGPTSGAVGESDRAVRVARLPSRCWIARLISRAVSAVLVVMATVSPAAASACVVSGRPVRR